MTIEWKKFAGGPLVAALLALGLAGTGCEPPKKPPPTLDLPPAYTSNQITDPALLKVADAIRDWAAKQTGNGAQPLYGKVEVLPPVPTVQPYGVGIYQQEPRLPVILITGPGWAGLPQKVKEGKAAEAFKEFARQLDVLADDPPLQPTLTIQTPEGMQLSWINHLDTNVSNVHGDE